MMITGDDYWSYSDDSNCDYFLRTHDPYLHDPCTHDSVKWFSSYLWDKLYCDCSSIQGIYMWMYTFVAV